MITYTWAMMLINVAGTNACALDMVTWFNCEEQKEKEMTHSLEVGTNIQQSEKV